MRKTIQSKLNELTTVSSGRIVPDDVIVEGTTYFGYEISENYINSDLGKKHTNRVNITGYVVRLLDTSENTHEKVDTAVSSIKQK